MVISLLSVDFVAIFLTILLYLLLVSFAERFYVVSNRYRQEILQKTINFLSDEFFDDGGGKVGVEWNTEKAK